MDFVSSYTTRMLLRGYDSLVQRRWQLRPKQKEHILTYGDRWVMANEHADFDKYSDRYLFE